MSEYTNNLNLFKYDVVGDAKFPFSITEALNNNWDKIDDMLDYIYPIGKPVITLSDTLDDNEIWLEGAEVSKTTYSALYAIYGDTYGTPEDDSNFVLPDFRGRVLQGADGFGCLDAGLPEISGYVTGIFSNGTNSSGALAMTRTSSGIFAANAGGTYSSLTLTASNSNSIYGNSDTVQPPAIKVRVKTRYT